MIHTQTHTLSPICAASNPLVSYYYYYDWIWYLLCSYQKHWKYKQHYTITPTGQMNGKYKYKYYDDLSKLEEA